jgi:hypothetical protein
MEMSLIFSLSATLPAKYPHPSLVGQWNDQSILTLPSVDTIQQEKKQSLPDTFTDMSKSLDKGNRHTATGQFEPQFGVKERYDVRYFCL